MRRAVLIRILAVAALAWLLVLPAAAGAFPVTGKCTLTISTTDAQGKPLDSAKSGDDSASAADPLLVDWEGTVSWDGVTQASMQNAHYHVAMFGMATPFQGDAANSPDARSTTGTFKFTANAPFRFTGTYYMSAGIIAANGTQCAATFIVKLVGEPIGTVPFFVGLALLAIGALLLVWGLSGHLGAAIFGGLVLGLGAALEAMVLSALPLAGLTPVALMGGGLALAALSAIIGERRLRRMEAAWAAEAAAAEGADAAQAPAPGDGQAGAEPEPTLGVEPEPTPGAQPGQTTPSSPEPAMSSSPEADPQEADPQEAAFVDLETAAPPPALDQAEPVQSRPPDDPWPAADLPPASAPGTDRT